MTTPEDMRLVSLARELAGSFALREGGNAGSVSAALRTAKGKVYTGICVDLPCGLGFCAEQAAVAAMLKNRETVIDTLVAVRESGEILAPCGRCRELLLQIDIHNQQTRVLLPEDKCAKLSTLMPHAWRQVPTGSV